MTSQIISKTCTKCGELKSPTKFNKSKPTKDGLHPWCKDCLSFYQLQRTRTKDGLITRIYGAQRRRSRLRGHAEPSYTNSELKEWLFSQSNFNELYDSWVESGYQKMKIPSCDRLNDYEPYTLSNLQLITWKENNDKGYADSKSGANNKKSKAVLQFSKDGTLIAEHYSGIQAGRNTGVDRGNLSSCCRGERKSSGGFLWRFA